MGTISDKLMRVINTKEDIRKALISKGYDVPASIPFKEYAKMILDLPCKIDDFPKLPGDVTRWHFGGLTNEMMAAMDDPRIEDADHKGRFLSFKNFAWKEGSGISDVYPGALVFDGVDDYGVCENFPILTKEKGYTVVALRQWIEEKNDSTALVSNCKNWGQNGAFLFEYNNLRINFLNVAISFGYVSSVDRGKSPFSYQTSKLYNGKNIEPGSLIGSNELIVGKGNKDFPTFSKAAIWELVFLDHDATEEELTKIKDYFVKTYPWLFFDQAWTVTGKTNEDEDRATIANITGNGNDLVLSNFAFSGNSGYGEYAYNFNDTSWISIPDYGVISDKTSKSFNIKSFVLADYPVLYTAVNKDSSIKKVKIKVTNSIPGFYFGNKPANQIIDLSTDGIYEIPSYNSPNDVTQYGFRCSNVNDSCNITIEQIPEYEGYLVTDGVDDIASSNTFVYEADFTFIGEWKFIQKDNTVAGINSLSHLYIQNRYNRGATVMINSTFENKKNITDYMTFKAITSKGKGYDENWNEVDLLYGDGNKGTSGVNIGGQGGTEFCHMLFKNMALYMNKVFSKDECIKAYNYLQTIKSK